MVKLNDTLVGVFFIPQTSPLNSVIVCCRAGKLLQYLGNVIVNGPTTPLVTDIPCAKISVNPPQTPISRPPFGLKDVLKAEGPEGFAKAVR